MTLLQSLHCKTAEVPGCWITVFARFSPEAPPISACSCQWKNYLGRAVDQNITRICFFFWSKSVFSPCIPFSMKLKAFCLLFPCDHLILIKGGSCFMWEKANGLTCTGHVYLRSSVECSYLREETKEE